MGRGADEVVKVVDSEDGEGEEEEAEAAAAEGSSKETPMLPRMPVRVLLAEGDDSTRHVISALLRKCGYRVAAASDGVKAWDILKEKSFNIDLVLTEVELPLMSGFLLLSTIMEHDASKNIPVIMMSSHDSVSMVFKCMLKGAADFLVKPLRKNELRNLWQHVWRKQLANGGPDVQHIQEENLAERMEQKTGVTKADNLNSDGPRKNRECSEQESDAQSSCTRSELEAESKQTNNILEYMQSTERHLSIRSHKDLELNGETKTRTKGNNLIPTREDDLSPKKRTCLNDNNSERTSRDMELVHIMDNQQKHDTQRDVDTMRTTSRGNDENSIPAHQLELSLRRTDYGKLENHEKNDRRTLNHSTSSAFYLYNCRTASSLVNAGDGQLCSTSETLVDVENRNGDLAALSEDTTETNRPPIRVVPFPVPVQCFTFDGQPFWNGTPVASPFYPQSAPPIWNIKTPTWQESTPQATSLPQKSQQNEPIEMDAKPVENAEEQFVVGPPSASGKQLHVEIPKDDLRHISPVTGESGISTVLDSTRNTLSSSGCDSTSNQITASTEPSSNVYRGVPETARAEGLRHLSQREAALNKFRLKRKDRCFEKKVRYQSRKLLAEQRPRVKGQFVRQDHSIQGS
uniref:Two-component response regulator-like PRR95 n=1 Tax=Zea mays TaxID=4577 RepID=B6U1H8_MAIZE|nr:two-component response regulator-like PRR95 [Zea mays]|eukprot:NP_001151536.1 two-component response regulator-like PRR95 isoform 2 [Zea mays]